MLGSGMVWVARSKLSFDASAQILKRSLKQEASGWARRAGCCPPHTCLHLSSQLCSCGWLGRPRGNKRGARGQSTSYSSVSDACAKLLWASRVLPACVCPAKRVLSCCFGSELLVWGLCPWFHLMRKVRSLLFCSPGLGWGAGGEDAAVAVWCSGVHSSLALWWCLACCTSAWWNAVTERIVGLWGFVSPLVSGDVPGAVGLAALCGRVVSVLGPRSLKKSNQVNFPGGKPLRIQNKYVSHEFIPLYQSGSL